LFKNARQSYLLLSPLLQICVSICSIRLCPKHVNRRNCTYHRESS